MTVRVKSNRPESMCFAETVAGRARNARGTAEATLIEHTGSRRFSCSTTMECRQRGDSSFARIYIAKRESTQTLERRSRFQWTAAATIIKGDLGQPRDPARFTSLQGIGTDASSAAKKHVHDTSSPCPLEGAPGDARRRSSAVRKSVARPSIAE